MAAIRKSPPSTTDFTVLKNEHGLGGDQEITTIYNQSLRPMWGIGPVSDQEITTIYTQKSNPPFWGVPVSDQEITTIYTLFNKFV